MSYFNISLVIPTFKREDQILKIVDEIQKQIKKKYKS